MPKQKLYAYVDESGQDTKGIIFVVGVVVLEEERDQISRWLEELELRTRKGNAKWRKSRHEFRQAYIGGLATAVGLRHRVFISVFHGTTQYLELTALAAAKAVLRRAHPPYKVTIFVDGLSGAAIGGFGRTLRDLHIQIRKIRGVRKDENSALIRLADALCGLVRDANDQVPWAVKALETLKTAGVAEEM